jgi:hypothetical protein
MTAPTLTDAIRRRVNDLATAAQTAGDALDGAALDLPEGTLASLLCELEGLAGRLDLALDRPGDGRRSGEGGCARLGYGGAGVDVGDFPPSRCGASPRAAPPQSEEIPQMTPTRPGAAPRRGRPPQQ